MLSVAAGMVAAASRQTCTVARKRFISVTLRVMECVCSNRTNRSKCHLDDSLSRSETLSFPLICRGVLTDCYRKGTPVAEDVGVHRLYE